MSSRQKQVVTLVCSCVLVVSLLSTWQSGPTNRVHACNAQALPVVHPHQHIPSLKQTVYVASGAYLYALQASNGAPRWCSALVLNNGQPDQFASVTHVGDQLYTFTRAGIITALTAHSGAEVWSANTGNLFPPGDGDPASAPSVAYGMVYSGRTSLFALSTLDGSVRWHYTLPDHFVVVTAPLASNGSVYVGVRFLSPDPFGCCQPDQLVALDAATGTKRWTFSFPQRYASFTGDLTIGDGVIVVQSGIQGLDGVDAQSGKVLWQKGAQVLSSQPTLRTANSLLYAFATLPPNRTDGAEGLYAFDLHTGAVRWLNQETALDLDAPLVVSRNRLYTIDRSGEVDAIDALSGHLLWSEPPALDAVGPPSHLILDGNELFVGTETIISPLDPQTGTIEPQVEFMLQAVNVTTRTENWEVALTNGNTEGSTGLDVGT